MSLKKLTSWTRHLSIRLKLTLLFVLVCGGTLVGFGMVTFDFLSSALQREFDDALYNYAVDVSESITLTATGDVAVVTPEVDRQKIYPFSLGTALIQIRNSNGDVITQVGDLGNFKLPFKRDYAGLKDGAEFLIHTFTQLNGLPSAEADSYRLIDFPLDNSPIPQLILQVAVPLTFLENQIKSRRYFLEVLIPLVILVATLGGFFLSTRALRPVTEIIRKANEIQAHKLTERLPVPAAKDEIYNLAHTLNQMLSRIQKSFDSQERFVADASHQLLTPLAIMKGELETHLKEIADPSFKLILISLHQEVDQLISLAKNMLMLARADAGYISIDATPIYFEEIVLEAMTRVEKIAKAKEILIHFDMISKLSDGRERPMIQADHELLVNAVFNVLENAIKYSPPKERVSVQLIWENDKQILSISDNGPGIPPETTESLFQRFSRGEGKVHGYGLGLAIAQKILRLHNGRLWVDSHYSQVPVNTDKFGSTFLFEIKNI
jgi:signal transduction histidine kinase